MTHAEALALLVLPAASWPTEAQVKAAYRARAKATHPDTGGSKAAFIRLKEAYDLALAEAAKPPPATRGQPFDPLDAMGNMIHSMELSFGLDDFQDHYNSLRRPKKARVAKPRVEDARRHRANAQGT